MFGDDNATIGDQIGAAKPRLYVLETFLWCHDSAANHDKVWGYVTIASGDDRKLYNFWGRRGKRMSFQRHSGIWGSHELLRRTEEKQRPRVNGTYQAVVLDQIETVCPGFYDEFEKQLTLAKLFNKVM